jgi:hypothetical protein
MLFRVRSGLGSSHDPSSYSTGFGFTPKGSLSLKEVAMQKCSALRVAVKT